MASARSGRASRRSRSFARTRDAARSSRFVPSCVRANAPASPTPSRRLGDRPPAATPIGTAASSAPRSSTSTASRSSQAGHRDFARETFEQLIARYPTASAAEDARRQLGELYRSDFARDAADGDARPALSIAPPDTTGSITRAGALRRRRRSAGPARSAQPVLGSRAAPQRVHPIEAARRGGRPRLLRHRAAPSSAAARVRRSPRRPNG